MNLAEEPDEVDRRYEVRELDVGWQFRGPFGQWETITRMADIELAPDVRIWTDRTGPDYSWRMPRWRKVYAVPPVPEQFERQPEIRIVQIDSQPIPRMIAVVTFADVDMVDFTLTVAQAVGRRGQGWKVTDRPAGGSFVTSEHHNKATALTALRRAARGHADALGIPVCEVDRWHRHEPPTEPKG